MTSLSASEAGKRAEALANDANKNGSTTKPVESMSTLLAHAGVDPTRPNTPMAPPIHMATTYTRPADGQYLEYDAIYTRTDNPTRLLLEKTVGELECHGAENNGDGEKWTTCAFSSGMMAVSSVILAHEAPLRVIIPKDLYMGVPTVLANVFQRFGVEVCRLDFGGDLSQVEEMVKTAPNQVIIWMETPSNPLLQVIDISAVCELAKPYPNLTTVVDATLVSPVLTQPLRLGVDAVMHSGTKYLGGHSDVLLGIVTTSPWTKRGRWLGPRLKQGQDEMGGVASPWDCWLVLRGLRTLHLRVMRQSETALAVAQFLSTHPLVRAVHYPGLVSHPRHDVAGRQMRAYGGVLSFELETEDMAMAVAGAVQMIQRATSLGGTETLMEHRASIEPAGRVTSPVGLLRISIGLEDAADIISDLEQALSIAKQAVY